MRIMDGCQTEKYVESLMSTEKTSTQNLMGWICPVCGRGLSPFTTMCPCKDLKGMIKDENNVSDL